MPLSNPVIINGSIVGAYNNKFNVAGVGITSLEELLQYAITTAEAGGGGAGVYVVNGWTIRGSEGITIESDSPGVYAITVPEGGVLESLQKNFTNAETDYTEDGDAVLNIAWNSLDYNSGINNSYTGFVSLIDSANAQRVPSEVGVTVSQTPPAAGLTNTVIAGINGVGLPCRIKIVF